MIRVTGLESGQSAHASMVEGVRQRHADPVRPGPNRQRPARLRQTGEGMDQGRSIGLSPAHVGRLSNSTRTPFCTFSEALRGKLSNSSTRSGQV